MLQTPLRAGEQGAKIVEVFIGDRSYCLSGNWQWELHCNAVFCSDVMFCLSREFEGTKGIIHPDDLAVLKQKLASAEKKIYEVAFRIITTYGEVKTIEAPEVFLVSIKEGIIGETDLSLKELQLLEIDKTLDHYQLRKEIGESKDKICGTGSWYFNTATNAAWFSDNVFRIYGLAPQSLNAHLHTFASFIHPEDRALVMDAFDKAYREQAPLDLQFRIISAEGKEKILHQTTQWSYTYKGEAVIKGMIRDDTEQKMLESDLEHLDSEVHFQKQMALMDEQVAFIGHWYINLLTRKLVYSDNCFRLHGIKTKPQVSGFETFINFVHSDDREKVAAAYQKIYTEQALPQIEYRIIHTDGKARYMRQQGKAVQYAGEPVVMGFMQDVTAQKMAERKMEELKEIASLRFFSSNEAENMASIGSWLWDIQAGKIIWSKGLYQVLGFKAKELTQKHLQKLVHIEDRQRFDEELAIVLKEKKESRFEFRLMRLGAIRHIKASFKVMPYDGKVFFIGTLQDITSECEMRRQLNERIQLTELFAENILDRALITDTNHTILLWNKECENVYKIKNEAAVGKNFFDLFPELKTEEQINAFNAVLKGQSIFRPRLRSLVRNEFYDQRLIPLKNESGVVFGIMHVMHDVTKEFILQQSLTERLHFIESLVEASVDRIIVMDRNMNYLLWNKRCEEYYGLKKEQVIGKNILEVFPASINDARYADFRKALRGETIHIPAQENTEDGSYYEVYLVPVKNEKDEVIAVLWMLHDLTREYILTKEHRKAQTILDTVNEACFELNKEQKVVYLNNSAATLWSSSKEELLHKKIWKVLPQVVDSALYLAIQHVLEEAVVVHQEFLSPITNKWIYATITPSEAGVIVLMHDIQEIKEAREKLELEHRQLKEAQALGRIGNFEWNRVTNKITWSDELYRIYGLLPQSEEVTLERLIELAHPEDRVLMNQAITMAIEKPVAYQLEHRIVKPDGEVRFVSRTFESVADEKGFVTKVRGLIQDVTERRRAEEKMRGSQNLLEQTTLATPDAINIFDINRKESVHLNNCLATWVNMTAGEITNMGYQGRLELVHPDDRDTLKRFNESMYLASDGETRTIEYRLQTRKGTTLWIRDRSKVFKRDKNGKPTHILSVLQDFTVEVELRNQLLERTRYAETIIDTSIDRIMVCDPSFHIIAWNKRSAEVTGVSKQQAIGSNIFELFPKIAADENLVNAFRDAAAGNYVHLPSKKSTYTPAVYERFYIPLKNESGETYAVLNIMHDISHMEHQREELKELNRVLEQKNKELAEKNEEIGSFAFIASHDLREPLRKLYTFSDWLLQRESGNVSETGKNFIKKIAQSVRRMDMLIEDVLILAKIGSDRRREIKLDLKAIFERVAGDMKDYIREKGAELIFDDLPVISGNDNQVYYLFKNLVSNAIKFQQPGNQPIIKITAAVVDGREVPNKEVAPAGSFYKIAVSDNGLGFEEKYFKKIFQVFQRLHNKDEYEGTGMGLAICRKIMENHNGFIRVESMPGRGSEFSCYFPIV